MQIYLHRRSCFPLPATWRYARHIGGLTMRFAAVLVGSGDDRGGDVLTYQGQADSEREARRGSHPGGAGRKPQETQDGQGARRSLPPTGSTTDR